jgi:hypothetical protein
METDTTAFAKVMNAKVKGQDPVKFIKKLDKKPNKETIRNIYNSSIDDVPTLSKSQLDKLIGPKVSPKKIVEAVAKKKDKPKVGTPSSVKNKRWSIYCF